MPIFINTRGFNFYKFIILILSLLFLGSLTFLVQYKYLFFTKIILHLAQFNRINNIIGILTVLFIAYIFSYDRTNINLRLIFSAFILQFIFAILSLKTSAGQYFLESIVNIINKLYLSADIGINFVFGKLGIVNSPSDFIFAVKVLPIIIFFAAFVSLLFYFNIIQNIIYYSSLFLRPILGLSGSETLCVVANSFLGQTEAPLLVKSYLKNMTKSEFILVMISGMGSISASILAVYASMGIPAKHLLISSILSIPASIIISKIIYPETQEPETLYSASIEKGSKHINMIDAVSSGTIDGLHLALNIGAMLIAFISLIAMTNNFLEFSSFKINNLLEYLNINFKVPNINLSNIFGMICLPFGYLLGFTGSEAFKIAELIGMKISINELVAYSNMVNYDLSERATILTTYALCGFSNFSCIAIQIGAIGSLVPEKRELLSKFGFTAVLGGALSNLLSAFVIGLLI